MDMPAWVRSAAQRALRLLDQPLVPLIAIACTFWLVYGAGVHWQRFDNMDELEIFEQALGFAPWEILFDPAKYQTQSAANFTPMSSLSPQLDITLFGVNIPALWAHSLLSVVIALGLFFLFLRRIGVGGVLALAVTILLMTSALGWGWVDHGLQQRHYVEGLALSLVALFLGMRALPPSGAVSWTPPLGAWLWASAAALCYLAACLYKEIYLATPFLLLAAPYSPFSMQAAVRRTIALAPMFIATLIYFPWRITMLSGFGGYGAGAEESVMARIGELLATAPQVIVAVIVQADMGFGSIFIAPVLAIGVVAVAPVLVRRGRYPFLLITAYVGFAGAIFLALGHQLLLAGMSIRWMTLPVLGLCAMFAWSFARLGPRAAAGASVVAVALAAYNLAVAPSWRNEREQVSMLTMAAFEFAQQSAVDDVLYVPATPRTRLVVQANRIGMLAAHLQGHAGGVAVPEPVIAHVLGIESGRCFQVRRGAYRRIEPESCFSAEGVRQLDEAESQALMESALAHAEYVPDVGAFVCAAARQQVRAVISEARFYHLEACGRNGRSLMRPRDLLRAGVEAERAEVTFIIMGGPGNYQVTTPRPLSSFAAEGAIRTER